MKQCINNSFNVEIHNKTNQRQGMLEENKDSKKCTTKKEVVIMTSTSTMSIYDDTLCINNYIA